jgi:hypothetical protein
VCQTKPLLFVERRLIISGIYYSNRKLTNRKSQGAHSQYLENSVENFLKMVLEGNFVLGIVKLAHKDLPHRKYLKMWN